MIRPGLSLAFTCSERLGWKDGSCPAIGVPSVPPLSATFRRGFATPGEGPTSFFARCRQGPRERYRKVRTEKLGAQDREAAIPGGEIGGPLACLGCQYGVSRWCAKPGRRRLRCLYPSITHPGTWFASFRLTTHATPRRACGDRRPFRLALAPPFPRASLTVPVPGQLQPIPHVGGVCCSSRRTARPSRAAHW
jgi:hypothetical protein